MRRDRGVTTRRPVRENYLVPIALPSIVLQPMSKANSQRCLDLLQAMLNLPTAPFVEGQVLQFVRDFVRQRKLHCVADRFGNLLVSRSRRLPRRPVIIVAHADHPGFIARRMRDRRHLLADWHGGVEAEYFVGTPVRFHAAEGKPVRGVIREITEIDRTDTRQRVQQVLVEVGRDVPVGSPGSWDLPAWRQIGRRIEALGCDDVAGLAAGLAALDLLAEGSLRHHAAVLVTRAEEAGLIGASAAAFAQDLPRDAAFVSIECSQMQPEAPQRAGPIVRVGDRMSVFDPDLTDHLCRIAAQIARTDGEFHWQRKLMPGGTCEASVFRSAGYRAAGLCIPLGHYHNRDAKRKTIAAEFIDRQDWLGLVRLIAAAALSPDGATAEPLAGRFREWLNRYQPLLKDPLARQR
jgi:putative aminopeptidase FrvX